MMGNLIITGPGYIDGRSATDYFQAGEVAGDIAHEHGCGSADEGIKVMQSIQSRLHVPGHIIGILPHLYQCFPQKEDDDPDEEIGIQQQERDVAGPFGALVLISGLEIRQGKQRMLGVTVHHIVDAGASTHQPMAMGIAGVDLGGVTAGDIELLLILVIPTKRGNVVVVAEHDSRLTGRGLRRQAAIRTRELIAMHIHQALESGEHALLDGMLNMPVAQSVDLHHQQARL